MRVFRNDLGIKRKMDYLDVVEYGRFMRAILIGHQKMLDTLNLDYSNRPISNALKSWEHSGIKCFLAYSGAYGYCCYCAVDCNHPLYNMDSSQADSFIQILGGLSYSAGNTINGIDIWLLGFDTTHDYSMFWSVEDAIAETNRLADQLACILMVEGNNND